MKKFTLLAGLVAMLFVAAPAMGAPEDDAPADGATAQAEESTIPKAVGIAIGMGLMVMGAAKGIGNIGGNAVQAIARQPEAGGQVFTAMLLSAALIEGFTFFALLVQFTL